MMRISIFKSNEIIERRNVELDVKQSIVISLYTIHITQFSILQTNN
ncbi:MAG: hypothetical protein RIQ33_670 [Bacteroidota bacterium]|jgi:hypothetical protein